MGKIISKPKAPALPALPTAPAPTPQPVPETPAEPTADELRVQNLLRRRRGRAGTITTSLRGTLDTNAAQNTPARKTLLGE